MSTAPLFQIGDRVRLVRPLFGIAPNTLGTIIHQLPGNRFCEVQFDGVFGPRMVEESKLALALSEPTSHE